MRKTWSESVDRRRGRNRLGWAALGVVIVAGVIQAGTAFFAPARNHLHQDHLDVGQFSLTRLHNALLERDLIKVSESDHLESTRAVSHDWVSDSLPLLSIVSDEKGLNSPEYGITQNIWKRGRLWERRADISYFEDGKLKYETVGGLRLHGGGSRADRVKSFKIIFRRRYSGHIGSPPGLFFNGESLGTCRFVLSNTRDEVRFLNALALELASQIGCETSRSQPVRLVINGERQSVGYMLLEHQSTDLLRHRYGHDDFLWVRLKEANPSPRDYSRRRFRRVNRWLRQHPGRVTMEEMDRRFDVAGLTSWMIAVTFFDTTDENQGGFYLNKREEQPRWRSLAWDMDGSFNEGKPVSEHTFRFDEIRGTRGRFFQRLMEDDPAYRAYLLRRAQDALDGPLSEENIRQLFAKYRGYLYTDLFAGQERHHAYLDETERFLLARRGLYLDFVRQYTQRYEVDDLVAQGGEIDAPARFSASRD